SNTTCGSARAICSPRRGRCATRRFAPGARTRRCSMTPLTGRGAWWAGRASRFDPNPVGNPPVSQVPSFITGFEKLAEGYDAVLSDVWGVVHNGVVATPSACEALARFREKGGTVILITNAPRPGATVVKFIDKVGVPHSAYD